MNKLGIWVDSKTAYIIDSVNGISQTIQSEVEDFHPVGGARQSTVYGTQDAVKDTQYLGRKTQQIKEFCEEIMEYIDPHDELVVFGPAQMKNELEKAMKSDSRFRSMIFDVKTADSMTENELESWVKKYYQEIL